MELNDIEIKSRAAIQALAYVLSSLDKKRHFKEVFLRFVDYIGVSDEEAREDIEFTMELIDSAEPEKSFATADSILGFGLHSEVSSNACLYAIASTRTYEIKWGIQSSKHIVTGEKIFTPERSRKEYIEFMEENHSVLTKAALDLVVLPWKKRTVVEIMGYLLEQSNKNKELDESLKFKEIMYGLSKQRKES